MSEITNQDFTKEKMSNYNQTNNQDIKNVCDKETPPPSKRHKIRMNRLFRERVGGSFLPFPEVDNLYERLRSKLVIKLKINEFFDHQKKRRHRRKQKTGRL